VRAAAALSRRVPGSYSATLRLCPALPGQAITGWEKRMAYRVEINGEARELDVPAEMPLLWALRNELGMVGTKFGCGIGACGACTVHVDGAAMRSCSLQVGSIGERKITTIEALDESPVGRALQQAWLDEDVMQCGYCQAGQLMNASALLARNPQPSAQQIDQAMSGNICRCACYTRIKKAIVAVVEQKDTANA
jgi:isoquinoline 1-oxidoreductase alpha subunit